jgi:hypothetical protein
MAQLKPVNVALAVLATVICLSTSAVHAQGESASAATADVEKSFDQQIRPLLKKFCLRCHNVDKMTSGIRVDHLDGKLDDRQLFLWKDILEQVTDEAMPPDDEPQPSAQQRKSLAEWIRQGLIVAKTRSPQKNGSIRRLTVAQYKNTLRDLLGFDENVADVLPPDAVSKDGFLNNGQSMVLSPLLIEAYFDIAEKALDLCIVDEKSRPVIQSFRMELGKDVNTKPFPEKLILGANSRLLDNKDFQVTELEPKKSFDYDPFKMRTKYRFIEGYRGNDTVRGWREYDSIYHAVFACMRGTDGYPKGKAYETIPEGLLLRPSIPSAELFQVESTYGPRANFKISLRELPEGGRFRVKVKAARYDDGLLLDRGATPIQTENSIAATANGESTWTDTRVTIDKPGIYQVDVVMAGRHQAVFSLKLGNRRFTGNLYPSKADEEVSPFLLVRLPAASLDVTARYNDLKALRRISFTRLDEEREVANRFQIFEKRKPQLGVYVGLRRDCGSTLTPVGAPQPVSDAGLKEFVFEGAINNFPSPDVEKDNVNYLAGVREIGVRSEYTDGREMPRLLIRSVEFEGPLYQTWPPATHNHIFIDCDNRDDPAAYARDVISAIATRAFRRPITDAEAASLHSLWGKSFAASKDFHQSIKDTILVVLTSPQFLFLIEDSATPKPEPLDSYELASKLSYFLWNSSPDQRLLELAAADTLRETLDAEIDRMIDDERFPQFTNEFTSQWLSLDKVDVVEIDRKRFPRLTRDTKFQLRREPERFVRYLIQQNLPIRNLIDSDFIVANEIVASYYDLGEQTETGFEFIPIKHGSKGLGGVLSQAGILAGLSDGRESNPVKRGAWLARKIIAEPPDDPPPNVPELDEDTHNLTLRERLALHRNQPGCAKCHSGIDPWGFPFEQFDAGGRFNDNPKTDASSELPDKTKVADFAALKNYLANDRIDRVAFSFLKHLSTYAIGRDLSYNEIEFLKEKGLELRVGGYRLQDMMRLVVKSKMFLEK